jgi:signal transduction histidine kinase/FixJ family two-component response regulator
VEARILVVDDEPGVLRLCQRLLERAGANVSAVTSASHGLTMLSRQKIDVLLADIRMPIMSGFQLMDVARQKDPEIAVVLMTGYSTIETAIEALQRGADGLIMKPFAGSELVQGVEIALNASKQKRDSLRLQMLRPLFDTIKKFFTVTNFDELYNQILASIEKHLKCTNIVIYEEGDSLAEVTYLRKIGVFAVDQSKGAMDQLVEWCQLHPNNLLVHHSEPADDGSSLLPMLGLNSCIGIPIHGLGTIRHIIVGRASGEQVLRELEVEFLVVLWAQANAALENITLNQQLRENVAALEKSQRTLLQYAKIATAGRLTASIAHEINNPLQSLSNCLHLVGREELDMVMRKKYLVAAQDELSRLTETVQRMLELYRPVARQRQPVSIPHLIDHVLLLMDKQLKNNNIKLSITINPTLPNVTAVGTQIQQVLINLLLNAIEAMPGGGHIWITAQQYQEGIRIVLEDSGPGIPLEEYDQIFEPFTSSKEQGMGLGLSVSYGIMQAHGGSLELITGRGNGACFQLYLPLGDKT